MFGLGTQELLVILVIAFFLFGAKRLPEIGRDLGKGIRSFKKGLNDIQDQSKDLLSEDAEGDSSSAQKEPKRSLDAVPGVKEVREIRETVDKLKA